MTRITAYLAFSFFISFTTYAQYRNDNERQAAYDKCIQDCAKKYPTKVGSLSDPCDLATDYYRCCCNCKDILKRPINGNASSSQNDKTYSINNNNQQYINQLVQKNGKQQTKMDKITEAINSATNIIYDALNKKRLNEVVQGMNEVREFSIKGLQETLKESGGKLNNCPNCFGAGIFECEVCDGKDNMCKTCFGVGYYNCTECYGVGLVHEAEESKELIMKPNNETDNNISKNSSINELIIHARKTKVEDLRLKGYGKDFIGAFNESLNGDLGAMVWIGGRYLGHKLNYFSPEKPTPDYIEGIYWLEHIESAGIINGDSQSYYNAIWLVAWYYLYNEKNCVRSLPRLEKLINSPSYHHNSKKEIAYWILGKIAEYGICQLKNLEKAENYYNQIPKNHTWSSVGEQEYIDLFNEVIANLK